MARRILITSGKGGVGKTSVAAHLGYALSKTGQRVVVIDMDAGLNNLDVVMGVENKSAYGLVDALDGKCRVKQTLVEKTSNLYVISSGGRISNSLTGKRVKDLTDGLIDRFDYLLIDSPAGVDFGFRRAASAAEEAILVVTPTITSLRDGDKVLSALNDYDIKKTGVIVNRMRGDLLTRGAVVGVEEIQSVLKIPVIGCVPEDDSVLLSTDLNLYSSRAEKAFKMIAKTLKTGKIKVFDAAAYYRGVGGRIRGILRQSV